MVDIPGRLLQEMQSQAKGASPSHARKGTDGLDGLRQQCGRIIFFIRHGTSEGLPAEKPEWFWRPVPAFLRSYGYLSTGRAYEQIRNSVAYPHLNVKIAGSHAGISTGEDGATHQCLEDIALMRTLPGMVVLNPADHYEMMEATKAALKHDGPVYIRLGRLAIDSFNDPDTYEFELGKGITLHEGNDVAVIASGLVVNEARKAVLKLESEGINARLINIHTIKPIDRDIIIKAAKECGQLITVEEHNVIGGLADAVCEVTSSECPVKVTRIGVYDRFGYSGPAWELLEKFGLTETNIAKVIRETVNK